MTDHVPVWRGDLFPDGTLKMWRPAEHDAYVATLRGGPVEIIYRRPRQVRSLPANSFYWGVVVSMIAEWTGYELPETHELLKAQHNGGRSTATLSRDAFWQYVDRCIRWAAMGFEDHPSGLPFDALIIPDPSTVDWMPDDVPQI